MHEAFWHERWAKSEIGFHQPDINEHLQAFIDRLDAPPGAHFLVPLCGKSLDMLWLAEQGYRVTGIEISERAARDFFTENQLSFETVSLAGKTVCRGERIEIWCVDFFSVSREDVPAVDAVYDRAALIALPPEMRPAYAAHLARFVSPSSPILLITLDYPQEQMNGPPFSVPGKEVQSLFEPDFSIEHLLKQERLAIESRFRKKGLSRMDEDVYLLRSITGLPA